MPIDRESTLRQAEKLQQQGRLDAAIAEYVRLVAEQPRDWNAINALGDLYMRSGDVDRATAQFVKIADHLFEEGFLPKAAALYKKALKTKPDHEHTLLRLGEIAAAQELLADARSYLRRLWELRRERGDDTGAAQCLLRLAALPEADAETQLTGARAAKALGDTSQALTLFRAAAESLQKAGRDAAALDAQAQIVALDPSDVDLRRRLVGQYVAAGQLESAGALIDGKTAGTDPDLLLPLALIQLTRKDDDAARATLTRFITLAPERAADVLRLAGQLGRSGDPAQAFTCVGIVVDDAVLRADWAQATDVLQSFLVHGAYVPALVKLVQVAGDAGLADVLQDAQERLAEAYIEIGQGEQAQQVAETLLRRAVDSPVQAERLRRALMVAGVSDPEDAVRGFLESLQGDPALPELREESGAALEAVVAVESAPELESEFAAEPASEGVITLAPDLFEDPTPEVVVAVEEQQAPPEVPRVKEESTGPVEFDLSDALAALGASAASLPVSSAPTQPSAPSPPAPPADLDGVFERLRPRTADFTSVAEAAVLYERALQRFTSGQLREALADLEGAARVPVFRFPAAARLGREYVALGDIQAGIVWLERAAEVPPPSPDDGLAVLYELGIALCAKGERTRALAVLMEIEAENAGYRDVRQRIDALARPQDGPGA